MLGLDAYRDALASALPGAQVRCDRAEAFVGDLVEVRVQGVEFVEIRADAHTIGGVDAEGAEARRCRALLLLGGACTVMQGSRRARLVTGELAFVDASRPHRIEFERACRMLVVQLPHERLQLPPRALDEAAAIRFGAEDGLQRVVATFLASLGGSSEQLRGPAGAALAGSAVDLLATLIGAHLERSCRELGMKQALFEEACRFIDAHLHEPDLTPARIAAAVYVSVRQLHCLFQERGRTVAGCIRARRLEHCYSELADPASLRLPVFAIGSKWGFKEASHFSRAFRTAFGESPSEVRSRFGRRAEARALPRATTAAASGSRR